MKPVQKEFISRKKCEESELACDFQLSSGFYQNYCYTEYICNFETEIESFLVMANSQEKRMNYNGCMFE